MTRHVAVIIGSLRKDSINRKMAHALIERAPASLGLDIIEIRDLPLYNQDADASPDAATVAFRDAIRPVMRVITKASRMYHRAAAMGKVNVR